jgi:hypothetical protein
VEKLARDMAQKAGLYNFGEESVMQAPANVKKKRQKTIYGCIRSRFD